MFVLLVNIFLSYSTTNCIPSVYSIPIIIIVVLEDDGLIECVIVAGCELHTE